MLYEVITGFAAAKNAEQLLIADFLAAELGYITGHHIAGPLEHLGFSYNFV